ncbi:TniB family NTP-binding protein [Pseudomonas putida]|uniref:TniB family NTP-binding protein n=1 Tax=Pseudomonas putida TaxID=303 RepID=UPI00236387A0|nr:TniB family NTP-binding protein [Pseudomonas putida]MDD1985846.1 TniB family NTP-binding protein [Pseudomonas putida]HDS1795050.1 TniB family NTP-binding protein [Pseudomonas putida]
MSNYSHLLPQFRSALELSDAERLASIKSRWIDYELSQDLFDRLYAKLCGHRDIPDFLILGESRMGKSSLINRFESLHGTSYVNEDGCRVRPIVSIEVSKPSLRMFYCEILRCSSSPFNPDATETKLRFQMEELLTSCHTKMLIIDEIQTIANGTSRQVADFMNEIKRLTNTLKLAIVGVGMPSAHRLLTLERQYAARFVTYELPLWGPSLAFRQLLKGFESWLPLKQPSSLTNKEIAALILKRSQGITGYVEEILFHSARKAIETGKEKIDLELLEKYKWAPDAFGMRKYAP